MTGLEAPGRGATLINGKDVDVFAHPTDIVIGTGGGSDVVQVVGTNVRNIQILAQVATGTIPFNMQFLR